MNSLFLIIFSPFIGSCLAGLFPQKIGRKGVGLITISLITLAMILAFFFFLFSIQMENEIFITCFPWINSGNFFCAWGFQFDTLTAIMLLVVTSISLGVHIYSFEYMSHDAHLPRFFFKISLFTFFMLILVTADNLVQMFLGWEGVGFCSYLLINFWFSRLQANKASLKAMIVNKISDVMLLIGLLTIFLTFRTVEYSSIFGTILIVKGYYFNFWGMSINILNFCCCFLLVGAMGKSAQVGLHTWLPDAMEGPTPVSALIHAATMVTAGIFLIARCSPLFEQSPLLLLFLICIGSMTAFFAGSVGLVQNDLKKVIAYSTCSQLGYMLFACGLSNYSIGIFHLAMHAYFKALLFLSSGVIIHALGDEQDMRRMGGLRRILPYSYIMFIIGSLSLMGFPFLTGFYSKDAILEVSFASHSVIGHFAFWLGTCAAFCTAFYSIRLIMLTFLIKTNSYKQIILGAHDAPFKMAFPLAFLALASIFVGYLTKDLFIGLGSSFWGNSIFIHPNNISIIDAEFLPTIFKILPVIFSLIGLTSSYIVYTFYSQNLYMLKISKNFRQLFTFLNKKWFFDRIYHQIFSYLTLIVGYRITYKIIDRGLIEILGPFGLSQQILTISRKLQSLQNGYVYTYALLMLLGVLLLILSLLISFNL